tara:strand:+ start:2277 stop:2447 length:171 start_codon:yes stop_codon:yes gene_type:complete
MISQYVVRLLNQRDELRAEVKRLREVIAKRDALLDLMNTTTTAFIDKYHALDEVIE